MTYEEINDMMAEMSYQLASCADIPAHLGQHPDSVRGIPYAYHHFAEGESPAPPFLLFLSPGEDTFSADNIAYHSFKRLDIELYTDKKNPALEEEIEAVLTQHEINFTKTEAWIESERLYEVLYEMTI